MNVTNKLLFPLAGANIQPLFNLATIISISFLFIFNQTLKSLKTRSLYLEKKAVYFYKQARKLKIPNLHNKMGKVTNIIIPEKPPLLFIESFFLSTQSLS